MISLFFCLLLIIFNVLTYIAILLFALEHDEISDLGYNIKLEGKILVVVVVLVRWVIDDLY